MAVITYLAMMWKWNTLHVRTAQGSYQKHCMHRLKWGEKDWTCFVGLIWGTWPSSWLVNTSVEGRSNFNNASRLFAYMTTTQGDSMSTERFKARSQNCEKWLLALSCLSVCQSVPPSEWNNSAPNWGIFMKLNIWIFFENLSRIFKFH